MSLTFSGFKLSCLNDDTLRVYYGWIKHHQNSLNTLTIEYNIRTAVLTSDISILLILVSSDPMSANLFTVLNNASIQRFQITEDPIHAPLFIKRHGFAMMLMNVEQHEFLVTNRRAAVTENILWA